MRCYVLSSAQNTIQSGTEATTTQHYLLSVSLEPAPRAMRPARDESRPRPAAPAPAPAPRVPFPEPLEAALYEPDPFLPRQIPPSPAPQLPVRRDSVIDGLEARSPSFTTTPAPIATTRSGPYPSNRGNPRRIRPANLINIPPPSQPPSRPPPQAPLPRTPSHLDLLHVGSAFGSTNAIPAQHQQYRQWHHQQHHQHHHHQPQQQRPQPQRLHLAAVCPRCAGTGTSARRGSIARPPVPPPISPNATVVTGPNCACSFPAPFPFPAPPTPNRTAAAVRAYNNSINSPTATTSPTTARAPATIRYADQPNGNGVNGVGRHALPNRVNSVSNGVSNINIPTAVMRTGPPPHPPRRRGSFSFSSGEGVRAAARAAALGLPIPGNNGVPNGVSSSSNGVGGAVNFPGGSGVFVGGVGAGARDSGVYGYAGEGRRATVAHVVAVGESPRAAAAHYEPDSEDEEAVDLVEVVDLMQSSSPPVSAFDFDSDSDESDDKEDEGEESDETEEDEDDEVAVEKESDSGSDSEFEFDMSEEDGLEELKVWLG